MSEVEITSQGVRQRFATTVVVGRDPTCAMVVAPPDDTRVSRRHGTLSPTAEGWVWEDTSTRGTFLDGNRCERLVIDKSVKLNLGAPDGPSLTVELLAAPGSTPPNPQGRDPVKDPTEPAPSVPKRPERQPAPPGDEPGSVPMAELDEEVIGGAPRPSDRFGARARKPPAPEGSFLIDSVAVTDVVHIGRAPDNDIVLADDLTVSRHHAELRNAGDEVVIVDVGSRAGTFVDGVAVSRARLGEGSQVRIGRYVFVLRGDQLHEYVEEGVVLVAEHLGAQTKAGHTLLDDISLTVEPGQLVAVVGPSGSGKSTLLRTLTGGLTPSAGAVRYNGRDVAASIDELRYRIGVVPQDDILHTALPLRQALRYSADLRFAPDVSIAERDARVDEVVAELGLSERTSVSIDKLSGGQRKRASVALELLTRPSVILLDEPTSGLDPGYERSVMELLRSLADEGRTVLVVTHAVASLQLCDRVLFLAPGGRMAFYGPPDDVLRFFEACDHPEVFQRVESDPTAWSDRLRQDPAWEHYVMAPARRHASSVRPTPPPDGHRTPRGAPFSRQLAALTRRAQAVLMANRSYLALLLAQSPAIAALLIVTVGSGNLRQDGLAQGNPRALLVVLVLSAAAIGLVNSCREIVREAPIYRRERMVGLSLPAYLLSKFVCLGALAVGQAALLVSLVVPFQDGPPRSVVLSPPILEIAVLVFLTTLAALALGLAVSALVSTDSAALVLVPVLLVAQLVLADAFLPISNRPGLAQAAITMPAYWGTRATAASADVLDLEGHCELVDGVSAEFQLDPELRRLTRAILPPCPETWSATRSNVMGSAAALVAVAGMYALVAALALRRGDPVRR